MSNTVYVQTELYMACTCGNHKRIVTYKIFINKRLKHTNVTIRLALCIYIIVLSNLGSSRAMLASDVWIEMLAILSDENGIRNRSVGPLSSEDVAVVVDSHWFTDCHLEAIFNMNMNTSRLDFDLRLPSTGKMFV